MQTKLTHEEGLICLAEAVAEARELVLKGYIDRDGGEKKEVALKGAIDSLPEEFMTDVRKAGHKIEGTGDNWVDPVGAPDGVSLHPDHSASLALTRRNQDGDIVATAMMSVFRETPVVLGDGKRGYTYDGVELTPIRAILHDRMNDPPRGFVFGQKTTPHWIGMNIPIGHANLEVKIENDCGPHYGIISLFSNVDDNGNMTPLNVAYIEPHANKRKEQLMAFVMQSVNNGIEEGEPFLIETMAGEPVFKDGQIRQDGVDEKYATCSFGIFPTRKTRNAIMGALRGGVLSPAFSAFVEKVDEESKLHPKDPFAASLKKMRKLMDECRAWQPT